VQEFFNPSYNWDLDHELYFGWRLAGGELAWTAEYNDKLPVVQFLFVLPGYFGNIAVWRAFSLCSTLLLVFAIFRTLPSVVRGDRLPSPAARALPWLISGMLLLLATMFPGGHTHINLFAANFALVAIVLVSRTAQIFWAKSFWSVVGTASLAAAVSISVRPYFLFPLAMVWLLIGLAGVRDPAASIARKTGRLLFVFLFPAVIGIAVNLFPYLVAGQSKAFFEGLSLVALRPNPSSAIDHFAHDWADLPNLLVLIGLGLSAGVALKFVVSRSGTTSPPFLFYVGIGSLSLAAGIATGHWWDHYATLFVPFLAVLFSAVILDASQFVLTYALRTKPWARYQLISLLFASALSLGFGSAIAITDKTGEKLQETTHETDSIEIEKTVSEHFPERPSFLVPYNMRAHLALSEPRHGFPHAANTHHIDFGWWSEVDRDSSFRVFTATAEYCQAMMASDIGLIFLPPDSPLNQCMIENEGGASFSPVVLDSGGSSGLAVWLNHAVVVDGH
jgi:hypothetical protein